MDRVVILGAGFSGIAACLSLLKTKPEARITLVDRNPFHLFTPSLYEVATSEEPQKNIAIPLSEIFPHKIEIIKEEVKKIDRENNKVIFKNQQIEFGYLIIALGSEPAFYGIPGLKENSYPLKTVQDAVKIKDKIHKLCDEKVLKGEKVDIIIGGGGFAGTELAAEILNYIHRLSIQHGIKRELFNIFIIQGSDKLLKELDEHVSSIATKRLRRLGADFIFGSHIKEVSEKSLNTDKGEKFAFNMLIWTGGVKANSIVADSGFNLSKSGQIPVNDFLQAKDALNVFAVGDIAEFMDPSTGKPAPGVGQVAEEQGKIAGENVVNLITGKSLKPYKLRHFGYLIPLKGRYAVFTSGMLHIKGFVGWVIQQVVFLRYLLGIMSISKAFKRWNQFEADLKQD
jgi:NADH dehydrogenase